MDSPCRSDEIGALGCKGCVRAAVFFRHCSLSWAPNLCPDLVRGPLDGILRPPITPSIVAPSTGPQMETCVAKLAAIILHNTMGHGNNCFQCFRKWWLLQGFPQFRDGFFKGLR